MACDFCGGVVSGTNNHVECLEEYRKRIVLNWCIFYNERNSMEGCRWCAGCASRRSSPYVGYPGGT